MKRKKNIVILIAVFLTLIISTATQAANEWAVNSKGDITLNGEVFRIKGGSWFGLEGRDEIASDQFNPRGAPMEQYIGNVFWTPTTRTIESDANEIKALGFNSIRLPLVPQTLHDDDPQGIGKVLKNDTTVRIEGAFTALKTVIKACSEAGLYVLLDMHSCSNYIGWRKGRLDARPPWTDAKRENYEFTREDCSCAATGNPSTVKPNHIQAYDVDKWLDDLKVLAGLGDEIGVDNILGIDIYNEPWDYSWEEWRSLIDKAYEAISPVNPHILIFAQGVGGSNGNQDGTPNTTEKTPSGEINPNWGENLFEAGSKPPKMPKSKLVYSPHTYGPSVCPQDMFADLDLQPECEGLVEDAFGNAHCKIDIMKNQAKLKKGWHEHFGYLRSLGYALCVGEFGGNMDWPDKAPTRLQTRYNYLNDNTTDEQWQKVFVDYLIEEGIYSSYYWSINPESGDTYGIYKTPFDPISNSTAWGTWGAVDKRKTDLLEKLWDAPYKEPASVNPSKRSNIGGGFNCHVSSTGQVTYSLPKAGFVSLKVYNVSGRLQSEVISQQQAAGTYSINRQQMVQAAGSYLVSFKAGEYSQNQMVYLKE